MKTRFWIAVLSFFLLSATPASAHYLWIESAGEQESGQTEVKIFYGEYEEGVRESAGGKLDEVTDIRLLLPGNEEAAAEPQKAGDHFKAELPGDTSGFLQLEELGREVIDWTEYDIGVVKPNYYASAVLDGGKEALPAVPENKTRLAVYPLELGTKVKLQVFFEGQPFHGAKVKAHAPNLWSRELKTDDSGTVEIDLPWPGQYVFEVIYKEKVPGEFKGKPYEAIRNRATFTWTLPDASRL